MANTEDAKTTTTHAVLVPGYWLGGWAWDEVSPALERAGITAHAVTLPGLDPKRPADGELTLDDHVAAVTRLVDGLDGDVVLVGHSGGGAVVQGVLDHRPYQIRRVFYVDTGPLRDSVLLSDADRLGGIPLPSWEELEAEGTSLEGLDDEVRERFRARAVDHPGGVARSPVRLTDERRLAVPATVICNSIPATALTEMVDRGQIPSELGLMSDVRYIDLPTGHWPMFSRPTDLAQVLAEETARP